MKTLACCITMIFITPPSPAVFAQGVAGRGIGGSPDLDAADELHLLFMGAEKSLLMIFI